MPMCFRSTPSREAPSRAIASWERTFRPSVFNATRTQPSFSKQWGEEEEFRLRVRRRPPERAREEGRADLYLTVGRPHVEEPRGADAAPGIVPNLREHDGLAARHQIPGFAHERLRFVEVPRRRPEEVAADLVVLHDLEEVGRVARVDRLEREPAAAEHDGREVHQITPSRRSPAISARVRPVSDPSTASVCWPSPGGARRALPGV